MSNFRWLSGECICLYRLQLLCTIYCTLGQCVTQACGADAGRGGKAAMPCIACRSLVSIAERVAARYEAELAFRGW